MPCDSAVTKTVGLESIKDQARLERALRAEFGQVTQVRSGRFVFTVAGTSVTLEEGAATSRLSSDRLVDVVNRVKVAYGKAAVEYSAEQFGWIVEWDAAEAGAFQLIRN